jgi:DNA-binding PucR family transcriptional regulator
LLPAVLADQEIGDELVRRYVEPLGAGEGRLLILETVRSYLSAGMRVEVSAEQLSVHHNTVRYRLRRYEELTGVDLRDPDRAVEAWWALQRCRIA